MSQPVGEGDRPEAAHAPTRPGYGPVAAVLVTVGIYLLVQVIVGLVIYLILLAMGKSAAEITDALSDPSTRVQFVLVLLVESLTLGAIWLFLRARRTKLSAIGLVPPRARDGVYMVLGYLAYFAMLMVITVVAKKFAPSLNLEQEQDVGFSKSAAGLDLWMIFASLVILPPLAEEIVMRGFLYSGLRTKLPKIVAAVMVSVLFAAAHLQGGKAGDGLLWVAALDTFTLSMILVYLRERSGSLWPGIGVHMLKNGIAFAALFIFKVL